MNYAIIGCGLIGKKRLAGLPAGSKLVVACDTNLSRAEELVKLAQTGRAIADFKQAVADPQVDAVIVATINAALAGFPPRPSVPANTLLWKNRRAFLLSRLTN